MHVRLPIDRRNGLRAGRACPAGMVEERVFERHPADLADWAAAVHRPLAPAAYSPLCPAGPGEEQSPERASLSLTYPPNGAAFVWDPHAAARQSIVLRARSALPGALVFRADGAALAPRPGEIQVEWPLVPGEHHLWVEAGGRKSDVVTVHVDKE